MMHKIILVVVVLLFNSPAFAGDQPIGEGRTPSLFGCYARIYDRAHRASHKGQLVVRATLSIKPATPEMLADKVHSQVAIGDLKMWIADRKQSFDSLGACRLQGEGLFCLGSISAAEADACSSKGDGVHQCRIADTEGSFEIQGKAGGVLITIRERLELVPPPYDGGPFLYLSPTNVENHDFRLFKTTPEACE
jgi:hypothetical protein